MTILIILTLRRCSYFFPNYFLNSPYQTNLYNTVYPYTLTPSYSQYLRPWPTLPVMFLPRQVHTFNPPNELMYNQQRPVYLTQIQSNTIITSLSINPTTQATHSENSRKQSDTINTKYNKRFIKLLITLILKKRHSLNIKFSCLTPEEIIKAVAPKLNHDVILLGGYIVYFNFYLKGFCDVYKHPPLEASDILTKTRTKYSVSIDELKNAAEKWITLDTMFSTKKEGLKKLIEVSNEHNGHERFDSYDNLKGVLKEDFRRQFNYLFQ